jgi:hypothetical protein
MSGVSKNKQQIDKKKMLESELENIDRQVQTLKI